MGNVPAQCLEEIRRTTMNTTARLRAWRKQMVRHFKAGLQSPWVFRGAMLALKIIEEIRRWWH
nr:hypothetical protein [Luteibacter rhizovicinus]